ncbi:MAG: hypothetical protein KAT70_06515 [Thermoplasmata archaeon]|nr:hypothetical protein [Thermoplasmata archaeon]
MDRMETLGYVSIIVLNLGWWIQVRHVAKTRRATGISVLFLFTVLFSFTALQIYTLQVGNRVYIVVNSIGMAGVAALLFLVLRYRDRE